MEAADVWNYFNRTLTANGFLTAGDVWNYFSRNLTFFPTVNTTTQINFTEIGKAVWNSTIRNLTFTPAVEINFTELGKAVWNSIVILYAHKNICEIG